jgi:hypothetical protein
VWLGLPADVEVPRLPDRLARLLMRLEEHEDEGRDRWGCWDFEYSQNWRDGQLAEPEIDRWLAARRAELVGTPLEPVWPDGRPLAVCLTHDVDLVSDKSTPRQIMRQALAGAARVGAEGDAILTRLARPVVRIARALPRVSVAPSTRSGLERSVEVETRRGIRASYLFTVPVVERRSRWDCVYALDDLCRFRGERRRIADVVQMLAKEGFDIGLHGSYQAGSRADALTAERSVLREATGLDIVTTRQHFLNWDVRWTPQLQALAGFRVDSSLGFNRNIGYRAGTSLPFRQFDVASRRPLDLVEVPLVVQDGALLGEIGIAVDLAGAKEAVTQIFDAAAETSGAVTFLFHPDKLVDPRWLALFEWTIEQALERGAWIPTLRALDEWWRGREARVLAGVGG